MPDVAAALAWQVDPSIKPRDMLELLKRTAAKTGAGSVINPAAVIETVKSNQKNI